MEKYVLPKYIQDSIKNGRVYMDIISSFQILDIFSDDYFSSLDEEQLVLIKKLYVVYLKAYITYKMINGIQKDEDSMTDLNKEVAFTLLSTSPDLEDILSEDILDLHDLFVSATKSDDDIMMQTLLSKLKLNNIYSYRSAEKFKLLSNYDKVILKYIQSKKNVELNDNDFLDLVKCYILYMQNINCFDYDEDFCAQPYFIECIVDSAYSAYLDGEKSTEERIKEKKSNVEKINVLKRIIRLNDYDRWR